MENPARPHLARECRNACASPALCNSADAELAAGWYGVFHSTEEPGLYQVS